MNFLNVGRQLLFVYVLYLFMYFYPPLANPFVPLNIVELAFIVVVATISFLVLYYVGTKNKFNLSYNTVSTIQTIIVIGLIILLVYNPLSFSAMYNIYPNRILSIIILIIWLITMIIFAKKSNINYAFILILFIPTIAQAILMSSSKTIIIYAYIPYLTPLLMAFSYVLYLIIAQRRK